MKTLKKTIFVAVAFVMLFAVTVFGKGWEETDNGWIYRRNNGKPSVGVCRGLDGEPYSFFFWPGGYHTYCTEDGSVGAPYTLAWGDPYIVICMKSKDGSVTPKYMADKNGHLMSGEYNYKGSVYRFYDNKAAKKIKQESGQNSAKNSAQGSKHDNNIASLYVPQGDNVSCTAASCAMMLRSRARMEGGNGWQSITLNTVKNRFWTSGGMSWSGSYNHEGKTYYLNSDPSSIKNSQYGSDAGRVRYEHIVNMLQAHPEGIVAYFYDSQNSRKSHAVFVTKVKNGNIYCLDPYGSASEIRIEQSSTFRSNFGYQSQDQLLRLDNTADGRFFCWFVE